MGEFLLELALELLGEVGLAICGEAVEATLPGRTRHPALATFGFALIGALGGWLSSFFWPAPVIRDAELRWLVIIVSPLACAISMFLLALVPVRRRLPRRPMHAAGQGFMLALAYQLVRFVELR